MTPTYSTEELIETLVAEATPVRRIRSTPVRFGLWLAAQIVFAIVVFSAGVRPDIGGQLSSLRYVVELAVLGAAVLLFARAAIAASVPGSESWHFTAAAATSTAAAVLFTALHPATTSVQISTFIDNGFPCAVHTTLLSLLPVSWLLVSLYRGAPLSAARAGSIAGAAGFLTGFTLMRVLCPADEALHVTIWHWAPVILGTLVSAIGGSALLPAWRR